MGTNVEGSGSQPVVHVSHGYEGHNDHTRHIAKKIETAVSEVVHTAQTQVPSRVLWVSSDDLPTDVTTREQEIAQKEVDWRANEKYGLVIDLIAVGLSGILDDRLTSAKEELLSALQANQIPEPVSGMPDASWRSARLHTAKALDAIVHPEKFNNEREAFKAYKQNLRDALESDWYKNNPNMPLAQLLNKMAYAEYALVDVQGFTESVANKSAEKGGFSFPVPPPTAAASSKNSQVYLMKTQLAKDNIHAFHDAIEDSADLLATIRGEVFYLGLDSTMQGNPVNVKCRMEDANGRVITNIRTPTPTGKDGEVTPEFKAFLRELKAQGLKYTMINLQDRTDPGIGKVLTNRTGECTRSGNLEALQDDPEFKDMFTCFTLDKNSAFYKQEEERGSIHAEVFKVQFLLKMKDEDSGFYLPPSFQTIKRTAEIEEILNGVHREFFSGQEQLSQQERREFIEVAYIFLADYFIKETKADFYNESCKDCIDRGGGANFVMMAFLTALEIYDPGRKSPDSSSVETRIVNLLADLEADAIWARKRPVIHERLERAEEAVNRVLEAFDADPGLAKQCAEKLGFKKIVMNADPSQATKDPRFN